MRNLYLGQRDGEAVVARLREVVASGEAVVARLREVVASGGALSAAEQLDVMLLPLMEQRRPLPEVLREVAGLARSLPHAIREAVIGTMTGLAYNYVEPALAEQLLEVLRMANVLEDLLAETLVRGRVESRREDVLSVLGTRFGAIPIAVQRRIEEVGDLSLLAVLVTAATTVPRLEDFVQGLDRPAQDVVG